MRRKPSSVLRPLSAAAVGVPLSALLLAGCASLPPVSQASSFDLGRNAAGDGCTATTSWNDPVQQGQDVKFPRAYSINCRGQQSSGAIGRVRLFDSRAALDGFTGGMVCGAGVPVTLAGFGNAVARRCVDPGLGLRTVTIGAEANGRIVQISTAPNAVGAGVQAARVLTGLGGSGATATQPIDIALLPDENRQERAAVEIDDSETILQLGTSLNFRGLHAEASRYLNAALSGLSSATPAPTRAEIMLEAGLADSNIRFFNSAQAHFANAERLLLASGAPDRLLMKKLRSYRGLDAMNQRNFDRAIELFAQNNVEDINAAGPLFSAENISQLNQAAVEASDPRSAIAVPDGSVLRQLTLDAQIAWALSRAYLGRGRAADATAALGVARKNYELLENQRIRPDGFLWLGARLDRQEARIAVEEGRFADALSSLDKAIRKLQQGAIASAGTGAEPAVAELQLERAVIVHESGAPVGTVNGAYKAAVDALVQVRDAQATFVTTPLQPYLDNLVAANTPAATDEFFRTLQVTGESGAARQISQLQSIVSAEGSIGPALRDIRDLERQITELNLAIQEGRAAGADVSGLSRQLSEAVEARAELEATVQRDARFSAVSDRPANIADIRAALADGEAYVNFTDFGGRIYGIVIRKDTARAFPVDVNVEELHRLVSLTRASIDTLTSRGGIPVFQVGLAGSVYDGLFRPIEGDLAGVTSLVVEGGQPLAGLSPGVLVTDRGAGQRFLRQKDQYDYSKVPFLAQKYAISASISPRSFIASRNLPASRASQPLFGFADPQPLSVAADAQQTVTAGTCQLTPTVLRDMSTQFVPISTDQIEIAAEGLGLAEAPMLQGSAFTDTALRARGAQNGDLSHYKVLHFATHGVTEGQFGCPDSPAALMTSHGAENSDMLLSFDEIARLRLDANLVVLAACETASVVGERAQRQAGDSQRSTTLDGLVRAFFSADAKAVMATNWKISAGEETLYFMKTFYEAGRSDDIVTALHKAQTFMIGESDLSHPLYWGAFFVVGDTRRNMLSGGPVQTAAVGN
ncbi:MAG TPA: CHAT domain-containing protein [Sphingopyxis sp.]|nr:CHAT domain-containing protein [Sphingopyxis sp.]HMP44765.1 CHAT domain-containing protein [Sphingopyxis sp.]